MDDRISKAGMLTERAAGLAQLLFSQAAVNPDHTALVIDELKYSYADLISRVRVLAAYLKSHDIKLLGILASRSIEAYAGVLAAHWVGAAYVPLNPSLPTLRQKKIIEKSQLQAILVDPASSPELESLLPHLTAELNIITAEKLKKVSPLQEDPVEPADDDLAYIIFTSGSMGTPKGVMISFANLGSFFAAIKQRYVLDTSDRVSQFSALSFDVSLFDMALAWGNCATLYVVPHSMLLMPASFIRDHQLTVWLSVPSVITVMEKLKVLKPNYFPSLKYSLFTGESLMRAHAEQWQQAAPQSILENLYGPTEATIDCLAQTVNKEVMQHCHNDVIPIGKPLVNVYAALINDKHKFLVPGEKGELVIAGPQIASGYCHAPGISHEKFQKLEHPEWGAKTWYLTGDYCYQDKSGTFHYLDRLDNQFKVHGHRVELNEIEFHIRELMTDGEAAVLRVPSDHYPHFRLIAVVDDPALDTAELLLQLKKHLPHYMLPARIIYLEDFIYNENGKLDRKLLTQAVIKKFEMT